MLRPYRSIVPRVHPSAFIDDSAQIIGDVDVGEESRVYVEYRKDYMPSAE